MVCVIPLGALFFWISGIFFILGLTPPRITKIRTIKHDWTENWKKILEGN